MIVCPEEFVMTKFPGYYWNVEEKHLYSIKSGWLKPLALQRAFHKGHLDFPKGYDISVKGRRQRVPEHLLMMLEYKSEYQTVPVFEYA